MTRSEKIIWVLFIVTSCQLVFLEPSYKLVAGERTNLFSGLLCSITLIGTMVLSKKNAVKLKSPEFLFSMALLILAGVSTFFSLTPVPSAYRVFVLLASGLGGFWCARLLLDTPENQKRFQWLSLFLLTTMVFLSLLGYALAGNIARFLPSHTAPLTNVMLLLSFAPLALWSQPSRALKMAGVALLCLGYIVLCLSERISVVFIPLGVFLAGAAWGVLRWKHLVLIILVMAVVVGAFHRHIIWHKLSASYPYYRVENLPFSWNIAKQHPWFGIGLRAPRMGFLKDYQLSYTSVPKEQFARNINEIVSPDNMLLAFITGLGFPFTLTYCAGLGLLLAKLVRLSFQPAAGLVFHPLVLLFSVSVAILHFQLFDGLLFPQSCWFFHLLLGLIPMGNPAPAAIGMPAQKKFKLLNPRTD
ncbi:MAG: O-antigen ligase family protein [Desulfobaccales bacterium]